MSHQTYNEEWRNVQDYLSTTIQIEPVQADRRQQRKLLSVLYLRYVMAANKLTECVDQMVQPQKRQLIRKLLQVTLGRVLELKNDLVEGDLCDYTHCGEAIDELQVTPLQIELIVPKCFNEERNEEITYKRDVIENVLNKLGFLEKIEARQPMTEHGAILIIQNHERARQGRLRAQFMKEIRGVKEKTKPIAVDGEEEGDKQHSISLAATLCIQKVWRGYLARRQTRRRKLQEMLLIGMVPQPMKKSEDLTREKEVRAKRKELQVIREREFETAHKKCVDYVEKYQRGIMLEQLSDQVRNWMTEYRASTGKIPEYTGSARASSRLTLSRQGTDSELSKSTSSKDSKSKKTKTKSKDDSKEDVDDLESRAIQSVFLPVLTAKKEEYDEIWKDKDETNNPYQYPYEDIIENEQMLRLENELRKIVDDMMRNELQLLQDAYDRDRGHKGKKPKKASKKARKGGKKAKKKKEKDLTPDRTTESLFEELVANGIIKKYPSINMNEFKGEKSYYRAALHNRGEETRMAMGDIRQILTEYSVIPLLSSQLHESTQHIKSILIAGSRGSGKDMLVQAICNETGSILFDLTPANIVGKYPGKSGLVMLLHLVSKVSRLLQPSVIYMDNAERPFVKKIPKTDKTDPKRLKKDLPKMIKNMCQEDRVILIGVSSCPWDADQKLLQQVYQKFLMIPRPDYSSRYCIWSYLLGRYSAISWQFDISGMSKISDGYTAGSIVKTVNEVMTIKRMLQLRVQPLSPLELINVLCKQTPVYKEEEESYTLWWTKTPMVRRRLRAVEMLVEEEADMQAKLANAKRQK